jgi:hypothetical protein
MHDSQKPFSESGSSPPVHLTVTSLHIVPGCPRALGEGLDDCGRVVSFAGDWRVMLELAQAIDTGLDVEIWLIGDRIVCWDGGRRL